MSFTETRAWHATSEEIPNFVFGLFEKRYQRGLDVLNNGFLKASASVENSVDSDTFQLREQSKSIVYCAMGYLDSSQLLVPGKSMAFEIRDAEISIGSSTNTATFGVIISLTNSKVSFTVSDRITAKKLQLYPN